MNKIEQLIQEFCPEGVPNLELEEVAEIVKGTQVNKATMSDSFAYPVYNGGIFPSGRHTESNSPADTITVSQGGASAGFVNFVREPLWVGAHCYAVSPRNGVLNRWLFFALKNAQTRLQDKKVGAGIPALDRKTLAQLKIPVPPLKVQQEIVSILDKFTELEEELEEELEARSLQNTLYRSRLLSFDSGVEWATLDDLAEYVNGKAHEKLVSTTGTIPLVTARFISRNGEANRYVEPGDVQTPAASGDVALVLSDLPNGRALARSFFVDADNSYAINQRIARLRVRDSSRLDPKFMFYVLDRNPDLVKHDNGVDQTHLSKSQVTDLRLPVPEIAVQRRIVRVLDLFESLLSNLYFGLPAEIQGRRKQYEYYRNKLLTFKELDAA